MSQIMSDMETLKEDLKIVFDDAKEDLGKDMAMHLKRLATLLHNDKVGQYLSEADAIDQLNSSLTGG